MKLTEAQFVFEDEVGRQWNVLYTPIEGSQHQMKVTVNHLVFKNEDIVTLPVSEMTARKEVEFLLRNKRT